MMFYLLVNVQDNDDV